jgi:hypothetical protein
LKAINKYFQTLAKQIETCSIAIIKFFIEWALVASIFIKKPQVITSEKVPMTHGGAYTMPLKYPTGFV